MRRPAEPLLVVLVLGLIASAALAQDAPGGPDDIRWTTFVGGPGRAPVRATLSGEAGRMDLGESPWQCGYGRPRHAEISGQDWSVQRVLACRRGEASVTSTASCRIHDGRMFEHAATLSLGTVGEASHLTVTLSCE